MVWEDLKPSDILTRKAFDNALANPSQPLQYDLYDSSNGVAGAPILNVRARRKCRENVALALASAHMPGDQSLSVEWQWAQAA